jgi:hypothetical protein
VQRIAACCVAGNYSLAKPGERSYYAVDQSMPMTGEKQRRRILENCNRSEIDLRPDVEIGQMEIPNFCKSPSKP